MSNWKSKVLGSLVIKPYNLGSAKVGIFLRLVLSWRSKMGNVKVGCAILGGGGGTSCTSW